MKRLLDFFKFTNGSFLKLASIVEVYLGLFHQSDFNLFYWNQSITISPKNRFDAISDTRTNVLKREDKFTNYLNHAFQCQPQHNRKPPAQEPVTDNENNGCSAANETHTNATGNKYIDLNSIRFAIQANFNMWMFRETII